MGEKAVNRILAIALLSLLGFALGVQARVYFQNKQAENAGHDNIANCLRENGVFLMCPPTGFKLCDTYIQNEWKGANIPQQSGPSRFFTGSLAEGFWSFGVKYKAPMNQRPYFVAKNAGCLP